jgi:hypothetical protein
MDNRHEKNGENTHKYRRPTKLDPDEWKKVKDYSEGDNSAAKPMYMGEYRKYWDQYTYTWSDDEHRINKRQEPMKLDDVVRVPLYEKDDKSKLIGYAYYWVMGDDYLKRDSSGTNMGKYSETVWNTGHTKNDDDAELDAELGRDGWYIIRTWAEDYAGNGNPYKDADRRQFGYAMVYVQNQDDVPPAGSFSDEQLDDKGWGDRVVLEGWHKTRVYTKSDKLVEGLDWYFGSIGHIMDVKGDASITEYGVDESYTQAELLKMYNNRYCKFFADIDFVAIQGLDPVSG